MNIRKWPSVCTAAIGALVAALAIIVMPQASAAAEPQPAMWVVRDADSTIYLLGTFHLIKPGTDWRTEKIDAAFAASDEIWTEVAGMTNPETQRQIQTLTLKHGLDQEHPLSSRLSSPDSTRLDERLKEYGLDPAAMDMMRPWLAAVTLEILPALRSGYTTDQGPDYILEADAGAMHKSHKGFEDAEQQIMIFANLTPEAELDYLRYTLRNPAAGEKIINEMVDAWVNGDVEALDKLVIDSMKAEVPGLYDAMFVQRNIAWSRQISAVMQGAGTSFVAVGAGHLIGDDGLPALLADLGFEVERY
jgi:uncharacterized protein YbaP (TraB family)